MATLYHRVEGGTTALTGGQTEVRVGVARIDGLTVDKVAVVDVLTDDKNFIRPAHLEQLYRLSKVVQFQAKELLPFLVVAPYRRGTKSGKNTCRTAAVATASTKQFNAVYL